MILNLKKTLKINILMSALINSKSLKSLPNIWAKVEFLNISPFYVEKFGKVFLGSLFVNVTYYKYEIISFEKKHYF